MDLFFLLTKYIHELCFHDCHLATSLVVFLLSGSPLALHLALCALTPTKEARRVDPRVIARSWKRRLHLA